MAHVNCRSEVFNLIRLILERNNKVNFRIFPNFKIKDFN